jgi:type II secretory pathway component PulC
VLFEMNGVSQRYEKGENIGTSGWVVVKIENGSAIVRRNGEVRTVSVGQKI